MATKCLTNLQFLNGTQIENLRLENYAGHKAVSSDTVGTIYWNTNNHSVEVVTDTEIKQLALGGSYTLPAATATSLGGVMVLAESTGSNISVTAAGVIDLTVDTKNKINKAIRGIKVGPTASQTTHTVDSDGNVDLGDVVIANDKGLIPQSYLPSYVDDVIEVLTYNELETMKAAASDANELTGKIYVLTADSAYGGVTYKANTQFRYSGSTWVEISKTPDIATEDEAKAGAIDTKFMTPAKTKAAIDELSPVQKTVLKIGDGTEKTYTIPHTRNSADLVVSVRDTATGEVVFTDVTISTSNVVVSFAVAPTTDAYTVTIIG